MRQRSGVLRILRAAATGLLGLLIVCVLLVLALRWLDPPVTAFMLQDDSGRSPLLHEWVPWRDLGGELPLAVVAAEDQKFAEHYGFDLESIVDAMKQNAESGSLRGGSTISQQVAKNLFLWPGRSYLRKGVEAWFTLLIEALWPKRRVLEVYLNVAEFGPGVYGSGAAAEELFGTAPARLGAEQAALMAAVLPSPKRLRADQPSAYLLERQRWILVHMRRLRQSDWLAQMD